MLKLYKLWTNNGNWNGTLDEIVIAESEEDALKKVGEWFHERVARGDDYYIKEMDSDNFFHLLFSYRANKYKDKYNIDIIIKPKQE